MLKKMLYFNPWLCIYPKKTLKIGFTLMCACILSACSLVGVLYQSAPKLLMHELNDYLDLNYRQYEPGMAQIEALYQWHRQQEIPLLVKQLRHIANLAGSPLQPSDVAATFDWLNTANLRLVNYSAAQQLELLRSLDINNLRALEKEFAKSNAKYRKKWVDVSVEDLQVKRFETIQTWFERLYGDMNESQRNTLKTASDARMLRPELAYALRIERQERIMNVIKQQLQAPVSQATLKNSLLEFISSFSTHKQQQFNTYLEQNRTQMIELIVLASNIATIEQRQYAQRTLRNYAQAFETIAKQP